MTLKVVNVGCVPGGEAFLLITEEKTAIVDSGFAFTAKPMVRKMKAELGDRPLDYILLTHSHYDHISGSSLMKKVWPDAKIVSHPYAAKIFEKESAMNTIRKMNRAAAIYFRKLPFFSNDLSNIHTDITVSEGDIIDLGLAKLKVIEAPGHTKDSIAFVCEEEHLVVTCETMGALAGNDSVMPACLVGFKSTMDFIERIENMHPQKMLYPHYGIIDSEEDCMKVISRSKRDNLEAKDIIVNAYNEGKDLETIKQLVKDKYYTDIVRKGQPETAFDLNNKYMVPMIIREFCE